MGNIYRFSLSWASPPRKATDLLDLLRHGEALSPSRKRREGRGNAALDIPIPSWYRYCSCVAIGESTLKEKTMPARATRGAPPRLSLLIVFCIQAAALLAAEPDVKLLGVRVDCSDTLRDAEGKDGKIAGRVENGPATVFIGTPAISGPFRLTVDGKPAAPRMMDGRLMLLMPAGMHEFAVTAGK